MKISVRFFASLQDITLTDFLELETNLKDLDTLKTFLYQKYPGFQEYGNSIRFALNSEYSDKNITLKENDKIALIPPTSGG